MTLTLSNLGPAVEAQLKPNLRGFFGGLVRGYLPQVWVFKSELETASFVVDSEGNHNVVSGEVTGADLTISWDHVPLVSVLRTQRRLAAAGFPAPRVIFHTQKGKTAFGYLRGRFGF